MGNRILGALAFAAFVISYPIHVWRRARKDGTTAAEAMMALAEDAYARMPEEMRADFQPPHGHFPCPCCGFRTLTEPPPGTYEICPVCFWEDDPVQFVDPEYRGGANDVSLNEARSTFRQHRVSDLRFHRHVRPPRPDEQP